MNNPKVLGAEVGEKLTRAVTDVIVLPGVPGDDNRLLRAREWGLRILTPSDLPAR